MKFIMKFLPVIFLAPGYVMGQVSGVSLKLSADQFCVFGGDESVFEVVVNAGARVAGRLGWRLSREGRTLARGEIAVDPAPGSASVPVSVPVPEVRDGVIFGAMLEVSFFKTGDSETAASAASHVWIFPENPFYGKQAMLEEMDIHLFDPERKTAEILAAAGVTFQKVKNIDALLDFKAGLVIIGEGISFADYRALPEVMLQMARNGVSVLCMAPAEGAMLFAGSGVLFEPGSIDFRGLDIIRTLDKRLADDTWTSGPKVLAAGFKLRGERGSVYADVITSGKNGWPWVEMRFSHPGGRLILCGFAVMEQWDSGPVPRFLFERILEYVRGDTK